MGEYRNTYIMYKLKAYRVTHHRSGKVMGVWRRTKHGETFLQIHGAVAQAAIKEAERVDAAMSAPVSHLPAAKQEGGEP